MSPLQVVNMFGFAALLTVCVWTCRARPALRPWAGALAVWALDAPPEAPPAGYVLVYVEENAGTTYLRVQDAAGTVKTLESWV